jgi:hypothetical protein
LDPFLPPFEFPSISAINSIDDKKTRPLWESASDAPQREFKHLYNKHTHSCYFSCADYTISKLRGMKMPDDMTSLLRKMERSRARLNAALDEIAPQVEILPAWKVKQVMDHVAGWDELVNLTLVAYSEGKAPPMMKDKGIDQYNEASVSARKELSIEQSRKAYDDARQKVLMTLRELPPEMLDKEYPAPWGGTCTILSIMKIFVSHELEHARQIEDALKKSVR